MENVEITKKENMPANTDISAVTKSRKREIQGKVTSNKADKTIIVEVSTQVAHPLYKKYYKRTKKVMAHDETNQCTIGDVVKVKEHRPISKNKRWVLTEVVSKAK